MNAWLFLLTAAGLHHALWRVLRGDERLSGPERHAAALTFQAILWTILSFALGFSGCFQLLYLVNFGIVALVGIYYASLFVPPKPARVYHQASTESQAAAWTLASLMIVAGGATALYFLWLGIKAPPVSYDSLSYHLGIAIHMYQDADLRFYPGESIYGNYFARGAELVMAISIMLAGKITLVNAVQWLIFPVMVPSLYSTARALGTGRDLALVAAFLPLTVPVIAMQSAIAYSDLYSNGWIVVGLCAVLGAAGNDASPARVLWMFAACGLAVAAKFNAALPSVLIGVGAITTWGIRRMFSPAGGCLYVSMAGFLVSAAAGLVWPMRNWVKFGSPIYPFSLEAGPVTIAEGTSPMDGIRRMGEMQYYDTPFFEKLWNAWTSVDLTSWSRIGFLGSDMHALPRGLIYDYTFGYRGDSMTTGFGATWILLLLPAMIAVLALAVVGFNWRARPLTAEPYRYKRFLLVLVSMPLLSCYLLVAGWVPRFSLFLPAAGGLCAVLLLEEFRRRVPMALYIVWTLLTVSAAFDAATSTFYNRTAEAIRRYHQSAARPSDTPIDYFMWLDPAKPDYQAINFVMRNARPGDTVSFWTPHEPMFTGLFADEDASIRQFLFPTVFPDPFTYSNEELMAFIRGEEICLLLTSDQVPEDFRNLIEKELDAEIVFRSPGYQVYRLAE